MRRLSHAMADLHARDVSLVDEQLLRKRISPGVEHLGRRGGARKPRRHLQQGPQLRVLLVEQREALHRGCLLEKLLLHRSVIGGQRPLRGEVRADVLGGRDTQTAGLGLSGCP